jgi:ABC-type Mn2+/Zn2+ transport system ATPase subunit
MAEAMLETRNLDCGYDHTLLKDLDLSIPSGEFVLVRGPNGIGKSTTIKTLAGLLPPTGGDYTWQLDESQLRYVPQTRTLDPVLPATVEDVMETGFQRGFELFGRKDSSLERIEESLSRVGMQSKSTALFRELSEGQKQLVLLARALLGEPKALMLDEPMASMDPDKEAITVDLLKQQVDTQDRLVLMVAHGSRRARDAATAILDIDEQRQVTFNDCDLED